MNQQKQQQLPLLLPELPKNLNLPQPKKSPAPPPGAIPTKAAAANTPAAAALQNTPTPATTAAAASAAGRRNPLPNSPQPRAATAAILPTPTQSPQQLPSPNPPPEILPAQTPINPEPTLLPAAPELLAEEELIIAAALAASQADNTQRAYAAQWRKWTAWAAARGLTPLPADPEQLARCLARQAAAGRRLATLRLFLAAVNHRHRQAGHKPPGQHPGLQTAMAGFARQLAAEPRQAAPLNAPALAAIRATAGRPRPRPFPDGPGWESSDQAARRGCFDIALAAVMRDALLRRSEAAALLWSDFTPEPDGSGRLLIRRSKTDQTGQGALLYLSPAACQDLARLRPEQAQPTARIFPLTPRQLNRRLQAMCQAAGLEGDYSGHPPRVGMAQDLAADRAELPELMDAGRWKSPGMPARYTRRQQAGRGAVAKYYRS